MTNVLVFDKYKVGDLVMDNPSNYALRRDLYIVLDMQLGPLGPQYDQNMIYCHNVEVYNVTRGEFEQEVNPHNLVKFE